MNGTSVREKIAYEITRDNNDKDERLKSLRLPINKIGDIINKI